MNKYKHAWVSIGKNNSLKVVCILWRCLYLEVVCIGNNIEVVDDFFYLCVTNVYIYDLHQGKLSIIHLAFGNNLSDISCHKYYEQQTEKYQL